MVSELGTGKKEEGQNYGHLAAGHQERVKRRLELEKVRRQERKLGVEERVLEIIDKARGLADNQEVYHAIKTS